jgi:hypothetical protein
MIFFEIIESNSYILSAILRVKNSGRILLLFILFLFRFRKIFERQHNLRLFNISYSRRIFFFCYILAVNNFIYGFDDSTAKANIISKLVNSGFENIFVKIDRQRVIIAYENRVYRFDVEAIKEILKIAVTELNDQQKIILIPQNRKIPIVSIETSVADCKEYFSSASSGKEFASKLKIDFNTDILFNEINKSELENSSSFRFDVALKPQLKFEFGPYEKPVISQINIVPELKTSWWKGMNFNYELIVPIVNEFGTSEDSVRPGIVALNQVLRLPSDFFVSSSFGLFTQNRFGLDLDLKKYFMNGDFSLGLNFGLTSFVAFSGMTKILYNEAYKWNGSISMEYRIPEYDLTLGLMAGRFLMGDDSFRLDVSREFGEIEIGFFAIRSTTGISNGGINITIPLFPANYWNPSFVRLKSNENFTWSYLVKTNPDQLVGLRYNTDNRIGTYTKKLNPNFIKNYFSRN